MNIVPAFVLQVISAHRDVVLDWCSAQIYQRLLADADDELLVRVHALLDCTPLVEACAAFHQSSGPGVKPTHAVSRLVRALLVKYLLACSLRRLEQQVRFNLLVKWFVGYPVFARGPDHSTLERFEQWVCRQQHRSLFDAVLRQIDAAFPAERQAAPIGDTFAMQANAAKEELLELLRHSSRCLLRSLAQSAPQTHSDVAVRLQDPALCGAPDEPHWQRMTETQRAAMLYQTVVATEACARWADNLRQSLPALSGEAAAPLARCLQHLQKICADELQISRDAQAQITAVSLLTAKDKGRFRLGSASDPEATYRLHGAHQSDFGYNVQIAVSDNFIREIQAESGAQPDASFIADVVVAQQTYHQLRPPKLIYDSAAGYGRTRAHFADATAHQTQLVAPLIRSEKRTDGFGSEQFTLSADEAALTCPQGQTSTLVYRAGKGQDGRNFHFLPTQCHACPLWDSCRGAHPKPRAARQVFISDYRAQVDAARAYNQTAQFKADMKKRPRVERFIAALVRYHGARHAQRRGRLKADFQAKMSALGFNLKRWARLAAPQAVTLALVH